MMHSRFLVFFIATIAVSAIIPSCGGDPTNPLAGCITIDKGPNGIQNNESGILLVHGQFANGAKLQLHIETADGISPGTGGLISGQKFTFSNEDFWQFNGIPKGTWQATWYATCDINSSPEKIDGPKTITVTLGPAFP